MEIENVTLQHIPAVTEDKDENGLGQVTHGDIYSFDVVTSTGEVLSIPNEPKNSHYQQLVAWYDEQEEKPFEFDFER